MRTLWLLGLGALAVVYTRDTSTALSRQDPFAFTCTAFPADLSAADLVTRFGAENVTSAQVIGSDDGPIDGTVLFSDRADARVDISWFDAASKRNPAWIRIRGERSRWRAPNGIALGATLRTLEQSNGRPFRMAGFGSELHGAVKSWAGGRLETPDAKGCRVTPVLQPPADSTADAALVKQVRSGPEYSSGHPALQGLNPKVVELMISHQRP